MLKYHNPTIAVVDSGIGGISVLRAIIDRYSVGNYIYYADNEYMPYGNKTKEMIRLRVEHIINTLFEKYKVDIVVLACNTASSSITNDLANVLTMKFDNELPYIATKLTKQNLKLDHVIVDNSLASQIERHVFDKKKLDSIIKQKVAVHHLDQLPTLVLGCTHYELVKDLFCKHCPNTTIINNSEFLIPYFNDISYDQSDLNINIILSKSSNNYYDKIYRLINI